MTAMTTMRMSRTAGWAATALCLLLTPVSSQSPQPIPTVPSAAIPVPEAAAIAQYWVLIAEGKFDEAAKTLGRLAARFPRNVAILNVIVETDIAGRGALTALTSYEAWIGSREMEEPGVLRRIARGVLYEWARQVGDTDARNEALAVLADDGDTEAVAAITRLRQARTESGLRLAVRTGDPEAIDSVAERIRLGSGLRLRDLKLLGESRSPRAVPVLAEMLKDQSPENRAAAADALGDIGGAESETALLASLSDPHGLVRISVAAALFKKGNFSGVGTLREMAASEHASVRRTAAKYLASQPDEEWKTLLRGLLTDEDPTIRLDAAVMLAPYDKAAAQPVIDALRNDNNPAIREELQRVEADQPTSSLPTLRGLMRRGAPLVRIRAAGRILALTR